MGLTKAQRHNNMMDKVFNEYHRIRRERKDLLPTVADYTHYLDKATEKLKISRDEARNKYGLYTYFQWSELLGI
jgi:hypothetical protein